MLHCHRLAAAAWLLGGALIACGPPRDESLKFDEKTCGTTDQPRDPDPPVPDRPVSLSGAAARQSDGSLRLLLNPAFELRASTALTLSASDLSVDLDGKAVGSFSLKATSKETMAPSDVVFVIDTTGSMFWAIEGVKTGLKAFTGALAEAGLDARVGGIEFGDEVRTASPLADVDTFNIWVNKLGVISGGDGPENPLDAMQTAFSTMKFRPGAQRYFIVITDIGFHESSDRSGCSDTTLKAVADQMAGRVLLGVVHAGLGSKPPGVDPRRLTDAIGGLYFGVDGLKVLTSFDVSVDTPFDELAASTSVLTIPASEVGASDPKQVTVRYKKDSALTLPVEKE